ncbi:FAD-dependent oxidoreductase [Pseudanabaena sp. FACHB-2040]|uniref:FAD-dependent oxidoreductase n=1 Tax=Pseudanabaena sp. FACHB-2040 TaxID=2692859 RepID=UPI001686AFD1|nr:FAD-dependent oxidoreductase [Pseudanabaena sp. FACHB-2040]MBD2256832.1 FAD-dependent oxidoreductase [Pseudanabaena sp. FACHB-2040]
MPGPVTQKNGVFADHVFTRPAQGATVTCSLLVVGGSTAAYSSTLMALRLNLDVCLVQPLMVVGGQFTAQALPASDDGDLLKEKAGLYNVDGERFAISKAQREFRERQREIQPVAGRKDFNPGGGWVSPFATTPVVASTAMNEALAPYLTNGKLKLIPYSEPVEVLFGPTASGRRRVKGVVFKNSQTGATFTVNAQVTIEATDLGDLLEVGGIESRVGQEARHETGEAILPEDARPQCQQSITFDVLVEHTLPGRGVPVSAPPGYGKDPWLNVHEFTGRFYTKDGGGNWQKWEFLSDFGIFRYRRVLRSQPYEKKVSPGDVSVINWGTSQEPDRYCCGNDYRPGYLVGVSREERQMHIKRARDRAQAYIHFLQTHGVPDLKLRGDLTWTQDGIALEPYIREARRGVALTTIRHEDVAESFFPKQVRARCFEDSVGIGQYHYMDLHGNDQRGHVSPRGKDVVALPFSLPLGALVPANTDGLVLSAKSLGTTHITNAAYRMHPMEWAIGEASGCLAVVAAWLGVQPRDLATQEAHVRRIQGYLARNGVPIFWFDDVAHDDKDFEPIQVLGAAGIIRSESVDDLHFKPSGNVSRAVVATALVKVLKLAKKTPAQPTFIDVQPGKHWAYESIETLYAHGLVSGIGEGRFGPDQAITREQLSFLVKRALPEVYAKAFARTPIDRHHLQRRELSRVLYEVLKQKLGI